MIKPVLQDDAFLADVHHAEAGKLHLWWLGQSGYLIQWQGHHLLVDPYLSDSLTKKYAGSDKPHVRMTERVIAPEQLDFIDVVTSSHNHTDHLDGETLIPLLKANPKLTIIVSRANVNFAANRLQVAHKCISLIIQVGSWTIYHSGDAIPYDGLTERLKRWKIDIAILPINGRDPSRGVPGNFTGQEAAELGKEIGAGLVIPCHYEMFEFNTVSAQGFVEVAEKIGQKYHLLKSGERLDL